MRTLYIGCVACTLERSWQRFEYVSETLLYRYLIEVRSRSADLCAVCDCDIWRADLIWVNWIFSFNKDLLSSPSWFVVAIERLDRDISGGSDGGIHRCWIRWRRRFIGVGSGEEEDHRCWIRWRRRREPAEEGVNPKKTVCSDSERIETPFYRERRVIGRRQLDEGVVRLRQQKTAVNIRVRSWVLSGLRRREESGVAAELGAAVIFLSYFLLIVSLYIDPL